MAPPLRPLFFVDLDETIGYMEAWYDGTDPLITAQKTLAMYLGRMNESTGNRRDMLHRTCSTYTTLIARLRASTSFEVTGAKFTAVVRPDAREFLETLSGHGEVHLLTSAHPLYAERALESMGLRPLVGNLYSLKEMTVPTPNPHKAPWVLIDDLSPEANGPQTKCKWVDPLCIPAAHTFQVPVWNSRGKNDSELMAVLPEILQHF